MNKAELGTLKTATRYKKMLIERGYEPENLAKTLPTSFMHILWMCDFIINEIEANRFIEDKYSRWLGYIQGVLTCRLLITVQEERDVTREWFT